MTTNHPESAENLSRLRGLVNGDDYEAKLPFKLDAKARRRVKLYATNFELSGNSCFIRHGWVWTMARWHVMLAEFNFCVCSAIFRSSGGVCLRVTWKMLIFRQDFWILMTSEVHGRYKTRAPNLGNDDNGRIGTFRWKNLPAKRFNVYHHSNIPPTTKANFRLESKLLNFPALQMKKACLTLRRHS